MKIISEASLLCFLLDLRAALEFFKGEMPKNIDFINVDSFYFYLNLAFPSKYAEISGLMDVLEPFVPVIISEKNLMSLLGFYAAGEMEPILNLEESLMNRSKLLFLNSAMTAENGHWENIMAVCCKIRRQRCEIMPR